LLPTERSVTQVERSEKRRRAYRTVAASVQADGNDPVLKERADDGKPTAGTRFLARLRVINDGGQGTLTENTIRVKGADSA
jgi:hypothetical protein